MEMRIFEHLTIVIVWVFCVNLGITCEEKAFETHIRFLQRQNAEVLLRSNSFSQLFCPLNDQKPLVNSNIFAKRNDSIASIVSTDRRFSRVIVVISKFNPIGQILIFI